MRKSDGGVVDVDVRIEIRRDPREVARARQFVRDEIAPTSPSMVADATLVVSELVTNAIEHGTGEPIVIGVGRSADGVTLQVTSVGPSNQVPAPAQWTAAPPTAGSGRGLGIVALVAAAVELDRTDDRMTTSVRLTA